MEENKKLSYLQYSIESTLDSFQRKRNNNKLKAFIFKILTVFFGASTTILLGLKGFSSEIDILFKNIALVLSAGITLFSAIEAFFNHRELWIRYTNTVTDLLSLKSEIHFKYASLENDIPDTELDEYFNRYQQILNDTNEDWKKLRHEKSTKDT